MDQAEVIVENLQYYRKSPACRFWISCNGLQDLKKCLQALMAKPLECARGGVTSDEGKVKVRCRGAQALTLMRTTRLMRNLLNKCLRFWRSDNHEYDASLQTLKIRAALESTFLVDNGISIAACALTADT
ncbi:hypothetical protein V1527DRAFT_476685 [Lipomyces starkeyi]